MHPHTNRIGWADLRGVAPLRGRVLVVEDDERVRSALERALLALGHRVRSVASAEEADGWLALERFDLALLDIDLPKMNGVEFLSWALRRDPEMAVIMVTGHDDVEIALTCLQAGARTFLVKPVQTDILRTAVEDALSLRWLLTVANGTRGD